MLSGLCMYHFSAFWNPYFSHSFQWITLATRSCLTCLYSFWASLGHSATMCTTVSSATPHNWHNGKAPFRNTFCCCYLCKMLDLVLDPVFTWYFASSSTLISSLLYRTCCIQKYHFCKFLPELFSYFYSIHTQSFTPIKPLPPSALLKYNICTSAFGSFTPYIVNSFLVFLSNPSNYAFVQ